jgi:hypothetical protein
MLLRASHLLRFIAPIGRIKSIEPIKSMWPIAPIGRMKTPADHWPAGVRCGEGGRPPYWTILAYGTTLCLYRVLL